MSLWISWSIYTSDSGWGAGVFYNSLIPRPHLKQKLPGTYDFHKRRGRNTWYILKVLLKIGGLSVLPTFHWLKQSYSQTKFNEIRMFLFPHQSSTTVRKEWITVNQPDNLPQHSRLRPTMVHPLRLGGESKFCKRVAACTKYDYYKLRE